VKKKPSQIKFGGLEEEDIMIFALFRQYHLPG
jgi:hypothetical protein